MRALVKKPIFWIFIAAAIALAFILLVIPRIGSQKTNQPAASDPNSFKFAVIGDTQRFSPGKKRGLPDAAEAIGKKKAAFAMAMGDLTGGCSGDNKCKDKMSKWKKIVKADVSQVYPVMGNHDQISGKADTVWRKTFDLPKNGPKDFEEIVYSFDYSNSHFIVLNSSSSHSINQEQLDWLEEDLTANQKTNIFVFFHEPAWPTGAKIGESLDVHPSQRDELWQILDQHDVTAVFSGHEHNYSRRVITSKQLKGVTHNIPQFIVGNTDSFRHGRPRGGRADAYYNNKNYLIVQVSGDTITIKDYSLGGRVMDDYQLPR